MLKTFLIAVVCIVLVHLAFKIEVNATVPEHPASTLSEEIPVEILTQSITND